MLSLYTPRLGLLIWLAQAEKLEPWKNAPDDSRIRLLNRLYAKKKKELEEVENVKVWFLEIPMLFLSFHFSNLKVDDFVL